MIKCCVPCGHFLLYVEQAYLYVRLISIHIPLVCACDMTDSQSCFCVECTILLSAYPQQCLIEFKLCPSDSVKLSTRFSRYLLQDILMSPSMVQRLTLISIRF